MDAIDGPSDYVYFIGDFRIIPAKTNFGEGIWSICCVSAFESRVSRSEKETKQNLRQLFVRNEAIT